MGSHTLTPTRTVLAWKRQCCWAGAAIFTQGSGFGFTFGFGSSSYVWTELTTLTGPHSVKGNQEGQNDHRLDNFANARASIKIRLLLLNLSPSAREGNTDFNWVNKFSGTWHFGVFPFSQSIYATPSPSRTLFFPQRECGPNPWKKSEINFPANKRKFLLHARYNRLGSCKKSFFLVARPLRGGG